MLAGGILGAAALDADETGTDGEEKRRMPVSYSLEEGQG